MDKLDDVVRYCEKYVDTFEYPLAYLKEKFGVKPKVGIDERVLTEAANAIV